MSSEQEDFDSACWAEQEQQERAQLEASRKFRRECDDFKRAFEADSKRIFTTAQAVNERK